MAEMFLKATVRAITAGMSEEPSGWGVNETDKKKQFMNEENKSNGYRGGVR